MKINTLAGLSGVSSETIRKYRDRDLLRPYCNPENGYYEYSNADFLNLLYIRKLRGASLSLETIGDTYSCDGAGALLDGYRETLEALEKQIEELKRREMMLRLTCRHYERDAQSPRETRLIESFGTKYDCYFEAKGVDPGLSRCACRNARADAGACGGHSAAPYPFSHADRQQHPAFRFRP